MVTLGVEPKKKKKGNCQELESGQKKGWGMYYRLKCASEVLRQKLEAQQISILVCRQRKKNSTGIETLN